MIQFKKEMASYIKTFHNLCLTENSFKIYKKWNLCGYFIQRQLSQPFGIRRAPSEPVSVISVVKNPTSIFASQNILKRRTNRNFLSFIANGVPQAISRKIFTALSNFRIVAFCPRFYLINWIKSKLEIGLKSN